MQHHRVTTLAIALAVGCGTEPDPEPTRVEVRGVREGEPLELEDDGTVELENDAHIYAALVRFGNVRLNGDGEVAESDAPVNVDLFERTILLDAAVDRVDTVGLSFPRPEGDGVTPGESLSVFVAGLIDDVPFEYRDGSMEPVERLVTMPTDRVLDLQFDLKNWFEAVEERELERTDAVIRIDEANNPAAARSIEAAIRASIRVATDTDDDS